MVRLDLGPQELVLSAEAPGIGSSEAKLPIEFLGGGDAIIRTAFNQRTCLMHSRRFAANRSSSTSIRMAAAPTARSSASPRWIYDRHDPIVRWVLMPVNAGLEATRENLGSNYPEHMEDE